MACIEPLAPFGARKLRPNDNMPVTESRVFAAEIPGLACQGAALLFPISFACAYFMYLILFMFVVFVVVFFTGVCVWFGRFFYEVRFFLRRRLTVCEGGGYKSPTTTAAPERTSRRPSPSPLPGQADELSGSFRGPGFCSLRV
jgi:hypothetical protein